MTRKRVVISAAGSESDKPQLEKGLRLLYEAKTQGKIAGLRHLINCRQKPDEDGTPPLRVPGSGHLTASIHRNPVTVHDFLHGLSQEAEKYPETDYALIMSAGWAAQLPAIADSLLRQVHYATNVFVIGVALEDLSEQKDGVGHHSIVFNPQTSAEDVVALLPTKQQRDLAAILSLTQVPGSCMIVGDGKGVFFGPNGFRRACDFAINGEIPEAIRQKVAEPKTKPPQFLRWDQVLKEFDTTQTA